MTLPRTTLAPHAERLAAIGVAFAAAGMLAWTWGTWPDPINDSGREIYVAWQLASGKVLYRDIAYFNGPLSPYVNAGWFALVGPGITKLLALNGVVLTAIAAATWRLIRRVAGWGAAAASVLVLVTVLAFGPLTNFGSFSYLLPYSHEMTHGLLLLLLLLTAIDRFVRKGGVSSVILAGAMLGLILLTKPEFVIAGCITLAVGFGLTILHRNGTRRSAELVALPFAVAVPPLVAWCTLATVMPRRVAFDGILGSWAHLTDRALIRMPYFQLFMGVDRPLANFASMLAWSLVWAGAFIVAVLLGRALRRGGRFEVPFAAVIGASIAVILYSVHGWIPWRDAFRHLPVVSLAAHGGALLALRRRPPSDPSTPGLVLVAAAGAMALALMLKMILFARVWHYGFVLGMPAVMIATAAGAQGSTAWAQRRGGSALIAGSVAVGVLLGTIASHLELMAGPLAARTVLVGQGSDAFLADSRGIVIASALDALTRLAPKDATLAVLPEGVMLSYLARRPNSTPYIIGNPADVAIFGEVPMLAAYQASPPDYVTLFACDTAVYGFPGFGQGYAEGLAAWIAANYQPIGIARNGEDPDGPFHAVIFKRREAEP